eukprot:PhF_6_TR13422/c0_g1_i1/m.21398
MKILFIVIALLCVCSVTGQRQPVNGSQYRLTFILPADTKAAFDKQSWIDIFKVASFASFESSVLNLIRSYTNLNFTRSAVRIRTNEVVFNITTNRVRDISSFDRVRSRMPMLVRLSPSYWDPALAILQAAYKVIPLTLTMYRVEELQECRARRTTFRCLVTVGLGSTSPHVKTQLMLLRVIPIQTTLNEKYYRDECNALAADIASSEPTAAWQPSFLVFYYTQKNPLWCSIAFWFPFGATSTIVNFLGSGKLTRVTYLRKLYAGLPFPNQILGRDSQEVSVSVTEYNRRRLIQNKFNITLRARSPWTTFYPNSDPLARDAMKKSLIQALMNYVNLNAFFDPGRTTFFTRFKSNITVMQTVAECPDAGTCVAVSSRIRQMKWVNMVGLNYTTFTIVQKFPKGKIFAVKANLSSYTTVPTPPPTPFSPTKFRYVVLFSFTVFDYLDSLLNWVSLLSDCAYFNTNLANTLIAELNSQMSFTDTQLLQATHVDGYSTQGNQFVVQVSFYLGTFGLEQTFFPRIPATADKFPRFLDTFRYLVPSNQYLLNLTSNQTLPTTSLIQFPNVCTKKLFTISTLSPISYSSTQYIYLNVTTVTPVLNTASMYKLYTYLKTGVRDDISRLSSTILSDQIIVTAVRRVSATTLFVYVTIRSYTDLYVSRIYDTIKAATQIGTMDSTFLRSALSKAGLSATLNAKYTDVSAPYTPSQVSFYVTVPSALSLIALGSNMNSIRAVAEATAFDVYRKFENVGSPIDLTDILLQRYLLTSTVSITFELIVLSSNPQAFLDRNALLPLVTFDRTALVLSSALGDLNGASTTSIVSSFNAPASKMQSIDYVKATIPPQASLTPAVVILPPSATANVKPFSMTVSIRINANLVLTDLTDPAQYRNLFSLLYEPLRNDFTRLTAIPKTSINILGLRVGSIIVDTEVSGASAADATTLQTTLMNSMNTGTASLTETAASLVTVEPTLPQLTVSSASTTTLVSRVHVIAFTALPAGTSTTWAFVNLNISLIAVADSLAYDIAAAVLASTADVIVQKYSTTSDTVSFQFTLRGIDDATAIARRNAIPTSYASYVRVRSALNLYGEPTASNLQVTVSPDRSLVNSITIPYYVVTSPPPPTAVFGAAEACSNGCKAAIAVSVSFAVALLIVIVVLVYKFRAMNRLRKLEFARAERYSRPAPMGPRRQPSPARMPPSPRGGALPPSPRPMSPRPLFPRPPSPRVQFR